jgi:F0F1-type ATP synthase assembly protein I
MPSNPKDRFSSWRTAGELSTIGLTLVFATAIGYFLGVWIGGRLGNSTWGGFAGAAVGIAAGFVEMFRAVVRYTRRMEAEDKAKKVDRDGSGNR